MLLDSVNPWNSAISGRCSVDFGEENVEKM